MTASLVFIASGCKLTEHTPARNRIAAGFSFGKLLDEAERYDEAAARFRGADESFLQYTDDSYDAAVLAADVARIIASPLDPLPEIDSDLPVFIVGSRVAERAWWSKSPPVITQQMFV